MSRHPCTKMYAGSGMKYVDIAGGLPVRCARVPNEGVLCTASHEPRNYRAVNSAPQQSGGPGLCPVQALATKDRLDQYTSAKHFDACRRVAADGRIVFKVNLRSMTLDLPSEAPPCRASLRGPGVGSAVIQTSHARDH